MGGAYHLGEDGMYHPVSELPEEKYLSMTNWRLIETKLTMLPTHIALITRQTESRGVIEVLKGQDPLARVGAVNSFHNAAEEIVLSQFL